VKALKLQYFLFRLRPGRKQYGNSQSKLFYQRFVKWFSRCKLSNSTLKKR
jgi:hypothetical protein